jgi:WD40 repeat protein
MLGMNRAAACLLLALTSTSGFAAAQTGGYVETFERAWRALCTGDSASARASYMACLQLRPESPTVAYHLACLEARGGHLDEALSWLARVVEWGFLDAAVLEWEPDLRPLRERGDLEPLVRRIRAGEESLPSAREARLQWNPDVHSPEFSPDGLSVTSGFGSSRFLWDVLAGEVNAVLPGSNRVVSAPERGYSADRQLTFELIRATEAVRVKDAGTRRVLFELGSPSSPVDAALFVHDERLAVLRRNDGFELWRVRSNEQVLAIPELEIVDGRISASEDGRWLLIVVRQLAHMVDLERGEVAWTAGDPAGWRWFWGGDVTPERTILATERDGLQVHETSTGSMVGRSRSVLSSSMPAIHPTERIFALACADGMVREIEIETGQARRESGVSTRELISTTYSADGRWRVDVDSSGAVFRSALDAAPTVLGVFSGPRLPVPVEVEISADGSKILIGSATEVALWDADVGAFTWRVSGEDLQCCSSVVLKPDGSCLAVGSRSGTVRVLDPSDGSSLHPQLEHPERVGALAFSTDGKRLATGCDDGYARIWNLDTGKLEHQLYHGEGIFEPTLDVRLVAFAKGSSRLLTTTGDFHKACLWDLASERPIWCAEFDVGHPCALPAKFSPDERRVYVAGRSCSLSSAFDVSGRQLADLTRLGAVGLDATPDGRFLVASMNGGTCALDAASFEIRWQRAEFDDGGWLVHVPTLHAEGTEDALRKTHVVFEKASAPMDCYAELLFDPRRVAASLEGIAVKRPGLPEPPSVELVKWGRVQPLEGEQIEIAAVATDPLGLRGFEVSREGELLPAEQVRSATILGSDGTRAELRLSLPRPVDLAEVSFEVRALGRSNVLSRPARVTFHEP